MNGRRLAARLQRLLAGVVLVLSGGYMLVYVYRWEWNRAILSGLFFVSAEVALAASMILRRLRALEQGATGPDPARSAAVLDQLRTADVERPNPFRWLTPTEGSLPVLVPVLLGAGAILSAIAYVVERVAEATALPAVDRRVADRVAALAPPPGGLLAGPLCSTATAPPAAEGRPATAWARSLVTVATLGVLGAISGNALVEAAQSRPDPADRPAATTIELAVSHRGAGPPATVTTDTLWIACRSTLGTLAVAATVTAHGESGAALVLRPGLGRLGTRRLVGCLEDVRLDLVRADVTHVSSTPPAIEP
jgi:hypothetical protein